MSTYINLIEAAKEIGITPTSLYKIVNHDDPAKRLDPVNRTTHRGDGGYRFELNDILEYKKHYVKKDLTSMEAARRIGRSTTFVHKLIRDGSIKFYEEEYRGKRTYFIKEEDLDRYTEENPDSGKVETIYDKRTGLFLFQPFGKDDQLARIIQLKRVNNRKIDARLKTSDDQLLTYEEAASQGWSPLFSITEKKPINGYGYAQFEFPIPKAPDSVIFTVIEELFKQAGPANLKITSEHGKLSVEVRKCVLLGVMPATHPDLIDKLRTFLRSGEIIPKYDGTLIETGLTPITIHITEKKKLEMIRRAEDNNMTLNDWIMSRLG
ncbi:helix-turn-helix domain-containing protein [Paenibacillus aestuarii]|uniref:Helix-turn-helix domain-containing protein n=1 Tax=Paenibacillus aestuarii TaxID=516965 RepID=A0ABW0K7U0_9BACL